jgi:hypothetical protein
MTKNIIKKADDDSRTIRVAMRATAAALSASPLPRYSAIYFTAANWRARGANVVNTTRMKVRVEKRPISTG